MKTLLCLLVAFGSFANAQNPAPPAPPKTPWKPLGTGLDKPKTETVWDRPGMGPELRGAIANGKTITVLDLCAAYAENQITFNQKFKGQQYAIAGIIEEVSADGTVTFSGNYTSNIFGVICQFADPSTLANLKKNQFLSIFGTISEVKGHYLKISNCSL